MKWKQILHSIEIQTVKNAPKHHIIISAWLNISLKLFRQYEHFVTENTVLSFSRTNNFNKSNIMKYIYLLRNLLFFLSQIVLYHFTKGIITYIITV